MIRDCVQQMSCEPCSRCHPIRPKLFHAILEENVALIALTVSENLLKSLPVPTRNCFGIYGICQVHCALSRERPMPTACVQLLQSLGRA